MRKSLIVLTLLTILPLSTVFAQSKSRLGLRVGVANTDLYGKHSEFEVTDSKLGLTAGFYVNSMISDYFWIKTEFNFVNKGGRVKFGNESFNNSFYYADIYPICLTFHLKGIQLFAGPTANFLVLRKYQTIDPKTGHKVTETDGELDKTPVDPSLEYRRLDFGYVTGLEYEFNFGLNFGVRWVRGLSSLYDKPENNPRYELSNNAYLLTLGYTFGRNND